jgi:hypothetical protein
MGVLRPGNACIHWVKIRERLPMFAVWQFTPRLNERLSEAFKYL